MIAEAPAEFDWKPVTGKPQVHHSSLDLLSRCGVAFEFRYIKKIKMLPSSALHVGRGVDRAANSNLQAKIDTKQLLATEEVLDIARDTTRASFSDEGVALMPDEANEQAASDHAVDKAVRLAKEHATKLAPTLQPQAVQRAFTIEIPNFKFDVVGTRDLDEIDGTIRDLKTSKKSPTRTAADLSDQGTLYALSKYVVDDQRPPIRFVLDTLVDLKRGPKVVTQSSERTLADFQVMANRIENAAHVLDAGIFTPARQTDWWCSLQYCAYARICPYFRQPVTMNIGEPDDE